MADETVVLQRKIVKKVRIRPKKERPEKRTRKKGSEKNETKSNVPGFLAHLIVLAFLIITILYAYTRIPLRCASAALFCSF